MMEWKRGATFSAHCTYTPPEGGLETLEGATITSQIRASGSLVADLTASLAVDGLSFDLTADETDDWPVGVAEWDVRIEIEGTVYYTTTVPLRILRQVTQVAA